MSRLGATAGETAIDVDLGIWVSHPWETALCGSHSFWGIHGRVRHEIFRCIANEVVSRFMDRAVPFQSHDARSAGDLAARIAREHGVPIMDPA